MLYTANRNDRIYEGTITRRHWNKEDLTVGKKTVRPDPFSLETLACTDVNGHDDIKSINGHTISECFKNKNSCLKIQRTHRSSVVNIKYHFNLPFSVSSE